MSAKPTPQRPTPDTAADARRAGTPPAVVAQPQPQRSSPKAEPTGRDAKPVAADGTARKSDREDTKDDDDKRKR
jgi:hypothetical protein